MFEWTNLELLDIIFKAFITSFITVFIMHLYNYSKEKPKLKIENLLIQNIPGSKKYTLSVLVVNAGIREIPCCSGRLSIASLGKSISNANQNFQLYWIRRRSPYDDPRIYDLKPSEWNTLALMESDGKGKFTPISLPNNFLHVAKLTIFGSSVKKTIRFWYSIPSNVDDNIELTCKKYWDYLKFPIKVRLWLLKRKLRCR